MKPTGILLIFLLLFSACNSDETPSPAIQTAAAKSLGKDAKQFKQFELDIQHYLNSYNEEHWDEVLNVTYMPMYGGKSKDDVMKDFVQAKLMGMKRTVELKKIEKVSKIVEDARYKYAKIFISTSVDVELTGQALENKDFMKMNMELSYDTQDVVYQEDKQTLSIKDAYTSIIAVSKKRSNMWHYIEVDKQKEPLLVHIIPEKVLDELDGF